MVQIFGLFQLISIVGNCFFEFKIRSRAIFFWGTLLIMIGIPQFLEMLLSNDEVKLELMFKASVFVLLFNIVYFICRCLFLFDGKQGITLKGFINSTYEKIYARILLILFSATLVLIMFISIFYFGGISQASWGKFYLLNSQLNLLHPFRLNSYIFFATSGVTLYFLIKKKWLSSFFCIIIILSVTTISGNRIQILPLITSLGILYLTKGNKAEFKKMSQIIVLSILAIYLVYLMRVIRIKGTIANFVTSFDFNETNKFILDQIVSDDGELGLRNAFYYFIRYNNEFPGFNEGASYIRMMLFWLPTSLSGGLKPNDFAITMGSAYSGNINNTTFSMHPTFYGDLFANFWWFGIILALFWAIIFKFLDIITNKLSDFNNIIFSVILCCAYVIFARGSMYNGFFMLVVSSVFMVLIFITSKVITNLLNNKHYKK